ncbi:uncharacterized protein ARMOST_06409 [Armillaria ostoyae]|uniref:Heterokaryon incompatibility domain-containing protein n=1 Tax=Armillaria ostoyae TaxID=47428 RepID=A0A284R2W5_ARMOS|nr:uncharacterized protein ARMOST_06409 [Armillaria ostoyae]
MIYISHYRNRRTTGRESPRLPVANPTAPFWSIPASPIQKEDSSATLPTCSDVVIIGSGITGIADEKSYRGCSRRSLQFGYSLSFQTTSSTPRGDIRAKHVVHTTNGYSSYTSHLLVPIQERIVPVRGHMTAQHAGKDLDDGWLGTCTHACLRIDRTISLSSTLTLRHSVRNYTQSLCLGGIKMGTQSFLAAVGCADDSQSSFECRHTFVGYFAWEYVANSITPDVNGAKFVIQGSIHVESCHNYTRLRFSLYTSNSNRMSTHPLYWQHLWIQLDGYTNPSCRDNKTYYSNLSNITITAPIEDGLSIEDIKVLNQRAYTGSKPVIPSSLADTPSASLSIDGLMKKLNSTLGTEYDLTPSLSSLLTAYISDGYDFGTVYGYLRPIWFDCDFNNIQDSMRTSEATDLKIRREALVDGQITRNGLRTAPRRVWDLFSNRVMCGPLDVRRRKNVLTPINSREWAVPIPKDVDLDLVRIEMLNLGAEYAWLDVLCLRQEGGPNEDLRAGEWMLDVPTIGNAYVLERVVCYFNGLGRPLEHGFDSGSDRSWFRRTWTLQETSDKWDKWMIGGDTGNETLNEEVRERFKSQLASVEGSAWNVVHWLSLLRDRTSEKDVDKVAALTYFLASNGTPAHNETRPTTSTTHDYTKIDSTSKDSSIGTGDPTSTIAPAYSELESAEDAWTALVKVMTSYHRTEMFALYHGPGPEKNAWRPSWQQAMNWDTRSLSSVVYGLVDHDMETGTYSYDGWRIESVQVQGLATSVAAPRKGRLILQNPNTDERRYEISALHQYLIPDGVYSMLYPRRFRFNEGPCVVGKMLPDQTFLKISVFRVIGWPQDGKSVGAKKFRTILG